MAGAMRKLGLYLGLVEDDEEQTRGDYSDDFSYDDDYDDDPGVSARRYPADPPPRTSVLRRPADERPSSTRAALALDPESRFPSVEGDDATYRITTLHPRSYNEARQIGEAFRDDIPVIMNLTAMADTDAKRLVDFAAGLIFGLHGSIERVTNKVFLLTPHNVEVTAEDKARIAEGGFYNQS